MARRFRLSGDLVAEMRTQLPSVAEDVVGAIIAEVPTYTDAFSGPMGQTIRQAVQVALGGFLSLAARGDPADLRTPTGPAVEGAYQLGRGEARSGRSTDAILAAYRIGARVSWREMSATMVRHDLPGDSLAHFAELVFAFIDQLSAASVAGHADETDTTGRVRQRLLERVAALVLEGAGEDEVREAAERAGWTVPTTLTAVLLPESQVRSALAALSPATLVPAETPGTEDAVLVLVPDAHGHRRAPLLRALTDRRAVVGPAVPVARTRVSADRARRAAALGLGPDTDAHLPRLVLHADEDALADLRARALAPLEGLRPSTVEKLVETLRTWLLLQGRRDEVAAALFVHPQTVRYRMSQLREAYGDALEDPEAVLALTLALA